MSGLVSLQQGPLGVAASARRPVPKADARAVEITTESRGANLDNAPNWQRPATAGQQRNTPADQRLVEPVAPGTLFEASQIAASLPQDGSPTAFPVDQDRSPWQPPYSPLHLRDIQA